MTGTALPAGDPAPTPVAIASFVECVYDTSDIVEVRLLRPGKVEGQADVKNSWHPANELSQQATRLLRENEHGWSVYVGANPRAKRGGAKAEDVAIARCLVADFDPSNFRLPDHQHVDLDVARERWKAAGLPEPTIIVDSGHGYQAWWRLTEPTTDLAEWTEMQKYLIRAVGSDDGIHDPPRIMRLPGLLNLKFVPQVAARIVSADPTLRYPFDQLRGVLGPYADPTPEVASAAPISCNGHAVQDVAVLVRATAYAAKVPHAHVGGRNKAAFSVAATLAKDFALPDADAWPILEHWNTGNQPPLSESELRGVLASARKNGKHTPGAKLLTNEGKPTSKAKRPRVAIDPYKPFPVEALPKPVRAFVIAAAKAIGCDTSYVGLPLLAALAATIGNKRRIKLKHGKSGWCEPSVVWCAIVGESGTLKSPALDLALAPLRRRQTKALREYREAVRQYERNVLTYDADCAEWKKSDRRKGEPPPEPPEEPKLERFIVSDTTVEALIERLQDNPNGLLLERDELAGWIGSFNQYKGGRGGDVPQFLSMHRAGPVLSDRKTGTKILYAERSAVSVCGGIQPEILRMALTREHFEDGLGARLLLTMPPIKAKRWTDATVDDPTEEALEMIFARLIALEPAADSEGNDLPYDLPLSAPAKKVWVAWFNTHADQQAELTGDLAAAWSKLEGYAPRLALIVHLVRVAADDPTLASPNQIDEESMRTGCTLSDWFGQEARRVYGVLGESDEDREERRLVEWIERKGGVVTTRDVQQGHRQYRTADEAEAALDALAKAGHGAWEHVDHGGGRGRPVRQFRLSRPSTDYTNAVSPDESATSVDVDNVDASECKEQEWTF